MADYDKEKQPLKDQGGGGGGERVEMKFIQGFRFVAMGWIIFYHYLWCCPEDEEDLWPIRLLRGRPLDLFTVLSGFVTHVAYGRRESIGGPFHFLMRRSAKVFFMYGFSLFITYMLHVIHWLVQGRSFFLFLRYFLCNILPAMFGLNVWFSLFIPFQGGVGARLTEENALNADSWIHYLSHNVFPCNGALWYIQTLAFCWFSYPLIRKVLFPAPGGSKVQKHCIIFLLWFFSILPAMICQLLPEDERKQLRLWIFIKVFPPFMLPSFALGAAFCDLYQQEVDEAKESNKPAPGWHETATFFGEIIFLFVVLFIAAVPTDTLVRFHLYCLAFGLVVFYFAVSSASAAPQSFTIGLKRLLESDAFVLLGDLSLVAYALQAPLSACFYFVLGEDGIMEPYQWIHVHWMEPLYFAAFVVTLYAISAVVTYWVDRPVSKWLTGAVSESTQRVKDW